MVSFKHVVSSLWRLSVRYISKLFCIFGSTMFCRRRKLRKQYIKECKVRDNEPYYSLLYKPKLYCFSYFPSKVGFPVQYCIYSGLYLYYTTYPSLIHKISITFKAFVVSLSTYYCSCDTVYTYLSYDTSYEDLLQPIQSFLESEIFQ